MKKLIAILMLFSCISFSKVYYGNASYYTERDNWLNGHNKTANGEIYNENKFTCASNKHKLGTLLRVENKKTGKSVICRVNDRGGFGKYNRVIDLSKASFKQIASLVSGVVHVKITTLN